MEEQLLLFEEPWEDKQERKIEKLYESHERLRKSLHAKNNELKKEVRELKSMVDFLYSHICKKNLF